MPSGPSAHVGLLVHDLDKAVDAYSGILESSIRASWKGRSCANDEFSGGADTGMRWATPICDHGAEMQFIQPGPGTPPCERLQAKGKHVRVPVEVARPYESRDDAKWQHAPESIRP